ncbi:BON domain-containing protein [Lysobacter sp. A6]|uniref:BON domain-containing protein n=1 Tax=Noviluteimonas lactosilytica TaxID=2888523 RepID=A0ABS8JM45_9GAMM|nr:BON domain-containing protein [Lysobacter lactosilyticus]MCC8364661.1 BON domain-containing protein [Lysobacter lactosilyticus]
MDTDSRLRKAVLDELEFEPSLDAANIGVSAEDNVVTLTGHVPTYPQKLAAERAAWRVKNVRAVVEDITVRYTGAPMSDEELAKRALSLMKWNSMVPDDIRVTIHHAWVTLEGEVQWQFQRDTAAKVVRHLDGIRGVTNNITLKPTPRTREVKLRIEQALRRNAETEARKIIVDLPDGHTVMLDGHVQSYAERMAAERAAWSVPGVTAVVDRIAIGP